MTTPSPPREARPRVGTIGAGYFSRFHVDAWLRDERVQFAALCDTDAGRASRLLESTGARPGEVAVFADAKEMLASCELDIVDIATPPDTHATLIELALGSAAQTVICQKPFCSDLVTAQAAAEMADRRGKTLVVHENFRFQPWYRVIRDELAAGTIGTPYQITFRLRPGDGQGPSAYLDRQPYFQTMPRLLVHETGVHWIDTFRFLFGEPDSVVADLRRLNPAIRGEDSGMFLFRYADGRRALFDGNRLADHAANNPRLTMGECLVEGSEGVIELDGFGVLWRRGRGESERRRIPTGYSTERFGGDCVHALQKHVVDGILCGKPVENAVRDYLRNLQIEEAIYLSAETSRAVELAQRAVP